jgi:hypothetical protein
MQLGTAKKHHYSAVESLSTIMDKFKNSIVVGSTQMKQCSAHWTHQLLAAVTMQTVMSDGNLLPATVECFNSCQYGGNGFPVPQKYVTK